MAQTPLTLRRWRRVEYDRLVDLGVFEGDPVELIGGHLVVAEPHGTYHASSISAVDYAVRYQSRQKLTFITPPSQNAPGEDTMDESDALAPFGFFTVDALRAGWYLIWRQLIRVVPAVAVTMLVGFLLTQVGLGAFSAIVMSLGLIAATIWAAVLIPRLTIQWAEQWYGATLTGALRIWWGVSWRVAVASLVAAVICTPPNFVALSLSTAYPASTLGMLGGLLTALLGVASFVVALFATGWAMSKVAVAQISTFVFPVFAPAPEARAAVEALVSLAPPAAVVVGAPAARPSPAPPPRPAGVSGKQCPKCGLHETERGSVIGWYCRICGWREGRGGR